MRLLYFYFYMRMYVLGYMHNMHRSRLHLTPWHARLTPQATLLAHPDPSSTLRTRNRLLLLPLAFPLALLAPASLRNPSLLQKPRAADRDTRRYMQTARIAFAASSSRQP